MNQYAVPTYDQKAYGYGKNRYNLLNFNNNRKIRKIFPIIKGFYI